MNWRQRGVFFFFVAVVRIASLKKAISASRAAHWSCLSSSVVLGEPLSASSRTHKYCLS